jgi:hypothetical protein
MVCGRARLKDLRLMMLRHLGLTKERAPCSRGFDKNFSFLAGAGNHYNHEPQLDATAPQLPAVNGEGYWMEGDKFLDRKTEMNPVSIQLDPSQIGCLNI